MDIVEYTEFSPFEAALSGRDDAGRSAFFEKFSSLPDALRAFLVSEDTAQQLANWERAGLFPPNYRTAVAKTVMLTALGDIKPNMLAPLLQRIGLPETQARSVADYIRAFVEPQLNIPEERVPEVTLDPEAGEVEELREIPPLTAVPQPQATVPNQDSRNIIDLRKSS